MKKASIEKLSSMIEQQDVYGPPPYSNNATGGTNINIGILIILFILGIVAFFNKRISKKSKCIIIISLIIIGIITTLVIKYFSTL